MAYQKATGLRRVVNAIRYSLQGFRQCFVHEEAFRQELYVLLIVLPLGVWLGNSGVERALLVGSALLVPVVELLNSAIEANVDRIGREPHKLSGRAKDIASAAVFLSIIGACVVWALVLVPRYL